MLTKTVVTAAREVIRLNAEERLEMEWIEASRENYALRAELSKPLASRHWITQLELLQDIKVAGDRCLSLLVALQVHRRVLGPIQFDVNELV